MQPLSPRSIGVRRLVAGAIAAALLAALSPAPSAAPPALRSCEYEGVERIVAVGDVHGAYDRYVEILRLAGVIDGRRRWAGGRTHFVQLGDIVDRGADSRKVLDLLMGLEEAAGRAGGKVHVLLGNHEVMRILGDLRYVSPGEYEAFATGESAEIRRRYLERMTADERAGLAFEPPLGYVEMRVAFGRNGRYGSWLHARDTLIRVNEVLFVHGGLSPAVAKMPCDTVNQTVRRELAEEMDKTRAAPLQSLVASENGPLWYRGLVKEPDAFLAQIDEILALQGARAIVVGHTVRQDGRVEVRFGGKVFAIDTGMQRDYAPKGRASALEIARGMFTAIYTDGRTVLHKREE